MRTIFLFTWRFYSRFSSVTFCKRPATWRIGCLFLRYAALAQKFQLQLETKRTRQLAIAYNTLSPEN